MSSTLIANVCIFDGVSISSECGHVLLDGGRIKEASDQPLSTPPSCTIIDGSGCTLIPGLIDAHVHVYQDAPFLETAVQYGVTTVLDMHNELEWFKEMKAIADKRNDVADVQSAGLAATVKDGWPSAIVRLTSASDPNVESRISNWPDITDEKSAGEYVARNKDFGASFIKLMEEDGLALNLPFPTRPIPKPSLDIQKAIVDGAHRHDMLAVAHAMTNHSTLQVLNAGVDGVTHSSIEPINSEIIQAFKKNNAFLIPTLAVHASSTGQDKATREAFAKDLNDINQKDHFLGCLHIMRDGFSIQEAYKQVQSLKEAGVDVLCGTDSSRGLIGTRAGTSMHHEMWLYVNRCGFTPVEALGSATSKIADRFGLADRGRIEEGRQADLVLVAGKPAESIDALSEIKGVWRNGERVVRR